MFPAQSPEWALLLLLSRKTCSPEIRDKVERLLRTALDWPFVVREACNHGVFPLVYRNLAAFEPGTIPGDVSTALKRACQLNVARNHLLVRELTEILRRFSAEGIPVLPLKGVALADSLFGDVSLRYCADLDMLVPLAAVSEAFRILGAAGYEPADGEALTSADLAWLLRSNVEHAFVRAHSPLLELHWDLVWRWRGDTRATDDVWRSATPTTYWGAHGYRLSAEWELVYLAVHAAHHRWMGLKWLVDIHEVCLTRALDWKEVCDITARLGWGRMLRLTLGICRALLGTPIPEAFVTELPGRWWSFPVAAPAAGAEALFVVRLLDRPFDKLAYLGRLLILPTYADRRLLPRHGTFDPIAYGVRPIRLAAKWGAPLTRTTFHRLRRISP